MVKDLYVEPLQPTSTDEHAWKYVLLRLFTEPKASVDEEIAHELFLTEEDRMKLLFSTQLPNEESAHDKYSLNDWMGILGCLKDLPETNLTSISNVTQFKVSKCASTESGIDVSAFECLFKSCKNVHELSHLCVLLTSKLPFQGENCVTFWPESARCEGDLRHYFQTMQEKEYTNTALDHTVLYHVLKN